MAHFHDNRAVLLCFPGNKIALQTDTYLTTKSRSYQQPKGFHFPIKIEAIAASANDGRGNHGDALCGFCYIALNASTHCFPSYLDEERVRLGGERVPCIDLISRELNELRVCPDCLSSDKNLWDCTECTSRRKIYSTTRASLLCHGTCYFQHLGDILAEFTIPLFIETYKITSRDSPEKTKFDALIADIRAKNAAQAEKDAKATKEAAEFEAFKKNYADNLFQQWKASQEAKEDGWDMT